MNETEVVCKMKEWPSAEEIQERIDLRTEIDSLRRQLAEVERERDAYRNRGHEIADQYREAIAQRDDLASAAQAVVDRWDSPLWKDLPATAKYIARLRAALAKLGAGGTAPHVPD